MELYQNFLGIDIGKFNFSVALYNTKSVAEYENSSDGIEVFLEENKDLLPDSLCLVETTGGYELDLVYSLISKGFKVHRADTRKVKNFIRSYGNAAKTDSLDALALAKYGKERANELELFEPPSKKAVELFKLVQRRKDLKEILVSEKNRLKSPGNDCIKESIDLIIKTVSDQIDSITKKIKAIISQDPVMQKKFDRLKTIKGIGDIVAFELLILLPELGHLDRRKIASLAGVAPIANESGKFVGYRKTGKGRSGVKPILFLAAMAARNSKSELKVFYEKLIEKGKKKMVALTALMRKILVIANAKLRDFNALGSIA